MNKTETADKVEIKSVIIREMFFNLVSFDLRSVFCIKKKN